MHLTPSVILFKGYCSLLLHGLGAKLSLDGLDKDWQGEIRPREHKFIFICHCGCTHLHFGCRIRLDLCARMLCILCSGMLKDWTNVDQQATIYQCLSILHCLVMLINLL